MHFFSILLILILTFLPSSIYARHIFLQKHIITTGIILAYALPTIFLIAIALLMYATRSGIVDFRVMIWLLLIFIAYLLPANTYSLFYIISKIVSSITHREIQFINYIGLTLATIIALAICYGTIMRHHIDTRRITIKSQNLPSEFNGIRIAHITDLHLGNLSPRDKYIKKIITKLQEEQPDMLIFTGDMMNLTADEAKGLENIFSAVKAPLGRYAVMGNHDYGDYSKWESKQAKLANVQDTYQAYRNLGFTLLNDTSLYITLNGDSIGIIGVENWSKPPFPRYGNLAKATENFTPAKFNILLSHDPTHWECEVVSDKYQYIDLTLSGHTHSFQFGININEKYKWSPSQFMFKHWDGLYRNNTQHLFVSRGLGYTAIPFRLGMPPEITIITLTKE